MSSYILGLVTVKKWLYIPSEREDDVVGVMWSLSINSFKESL